MRKVVGIWDDLIGILRREKTVAIRQQTELLEEGAIVGLAKADGENEALQDLRHSKERSEHWHHTAARYGTFPLQRLLRGQRARS